MKKMFAGCRELAEVALGKESKIFNRKADWGDRIFAGLLCFLIVGGIGGGGYLLLHLLTSTFGLMIMCLVVGVIALSIGCVYVVYYVSRFGCDCCDKVEHVKDLVKKLDDKTKEEIASK
jgi:hypothetical protein